MLTEFRGGGGGGGGGEEGHESRLLRLLTWRRNGKNAYIRKFSIYFDLSKTAKYAYVANQIRMRSPSLNAISLIPLALSNITAPKIHPQECRFHDSCNIFIVGGGGGGGGYLPWYSSK